MKMQQTVLPIVFCGALISLMGCASESCTMQFNAKIDDAHQALLAGQIEEVLTKLDEADVIASDCPCDKSDLDRMKVETYLSQGKTIEAYDLAKQLLGADPKDPFANELVGKICLTEGEFKEAEMNLSKALKAYRDSKDISRAKDLLALTRFFLAYQDANPKLAEQYMLEIEDSQLVYALDKARKDESVTQKN